MALSVFFATFDNTLGPRIEAQVPRAFLDQQAFDSISDYIIVSDEELCHSLLMVKAYGYQVLSYPVCIRHSKYERHAFLFSFGMLFAEDADTSAYRPVLRKLVEAFHTQELDCEFLSNADTKARIGGILASVFYEIRECGECFVPVDETTTLALKLQHRLLDPPEVLDFQVPVMVRHLDGLITKEWDLTIQRVLPHIDGVKYVQKIALDADVDIALARRCIRQLLYFRCILMIDIFQFSNQYTCTPHIADFGESDFATQRECARYITLVGFDPPPFTKVFKIYCSLRYGVCVDDVCIAYDLVALHVDARRLITYGLINGLIRRIHTFLVRNVDGVHSGGGSNDCIDVAALPASDADAISQVHALADGRHCFDDICARLMRPAAEQVFKARFGD